MTLVVYHPLVIHVSVTYFLTLVSVYVVARPTTPLPLSRLPTSGFEVRRFLLSSTVFTAHYPF